MANFSAKRELASANHLNMITHSYLFVKDFLIKFSIQGAEIPPLLLKYAQICQQILRTCYRLSQPFPSPAR